VCFPAKGYTHFSTFHMTMNVLIACKILLVCPDYAAEFPSKEEHYGGGELRLLLPAPAVEAQRSQQA
jgi:hypothetical protein